MPPSLFVHLLKIGMPQQPGAAGEFVLPGLTGQIGTPNSERSRAQAAGCHLRIPVCPEKGSYSRKPGFTDTRLRPFARRREITARPCLVFMRVRKPWVLERRRRFGWNVRLGM